MAVVGTNILFWQSNAVLHNVKAAEEIDIPMRLAPKVLQDVPPVPSARVLSLAQERGLPTGPLSLRPKKRPRPAMEGSCRLLHHL